MNGMKAVKLLISLICMSCVSCTHFQTVNSIENERNYVLKLSKSNEYILSDTLFLLSQRNLVLDANNEIKENNILGLFYRINSGNYRIEMHLFTPNKTISYLLNGRSNQYSKIVRVGNFSQLSCKGVNKSYIGDFSQLDIRDADNAYISFFRGSEIDRAVIYAPNIAFLHNSLLEKNGSVLKPNSEKVSSAYKNLSKCVIQLENIIESSEIIKR